ncbi:MAG: sugar kinase [Bacillota bacterium]|nr:sugar kinase [Bacillota bacterium]
MKTLLTFGEIMMRLSPPGHLRFLQAGEFLVSFAGTESNVAVNLAHWGMDAAFLTKLPDNELGQAAVNDLRRFGVDTSRVLRGGPRLGVFFVEKGASQRASKVIYDRAGSSLAAACREEFDWDALLEGADWFHFSGITPALGGQTPEICLDACRAAKSKGLTVSCDTNYRATLWSPSLAGKTMELLMPYVDVCFSNGGDAAALFGIHPRNQGRTAPGEALSQEAYLDVALQLAERFSLRQVAFTMRQGQSADVNRWQGMFWDGRDAFFSREYTIQLVDRIGGGDAFDAALLYALRRGQSSQEAVELAAAASCLQQTIEFDYSLVSLEEALALAAGEASGRIRR